MKDKIQLAIAGRRLAEFVYDGRRRVVEPHDYGTRGDHHDHQDWETLFARVS